MSARVPYLSGLLLKFLNGPFVDAPAFVDKMASGGGFARVHMSNDNNVDMGLLLPHPSSPSLVLNSQLALGKGWETEQRLRSRLLQGEEKANKEIRSVAMSNRITTQLQPHNAKPPGLRPHSRHYVWISSNNRLSPHFEH